MTPYESGDLTIATAALLFNFLAVLFVGLEIRRSRKAGREEALRLARQATLDYYSSTLAERNRLRDAVRNAPAQPGVAMDSVESELVAMDPTVPERKSAKIRYLAYWETFATGVNMGVFDLECARRLAAARIKKIWQDHASFVVSRREESGNQALYKELEDLARKFGVSQDSPDVVLSAEAELAN